MGHVTHLTSPLPAPSSMIRRRRLIQCDPIPVEPSTGWGWACTCEAHDNGYAHSWLAIEAAEHHARTAPAVPRSSPRRALPCHQQRGARTENFDAIARRALAYGRTWSVLS